MLKDSKFTEIDEEFICENCGKKVPKLGYSCRNHCPYCLHSKHVDKNPGDRAEECHGDLEPVSLEINGKKGYVIVFKCKKCGAIRKNKAANFIMCVLKIKLISKKIYLSIGGGQVGRPFCNFLKCQKRASQLTTLFKLLYLNFH